MPHMAYRVLVFKLYTNYFYGQFSGQFENLNVVFFIFYFKIYFYVCVDDIIYAKQIKWTVVIMSFIYKI